MIGTFIALNMHWRKQALIRHSQLSLMQHCTQTLRAVISLPHFVHPLRLILLANQIHMVAELSRYFFFLGLAGRHISGQLGNL